jgi:hypothetical protein
MAFMMNDNKAKTQLMRSQPSNPLRQGHISAGPCGVETRATLCSEA